jgi:endogenous inhibitor of DNA gyrase (YacG/DUF329 family)
MALERFLDLIRCHVCSLRIAQTSVYCDLSEFHLTVYAKIAKSKDMFKSERPSPPAAAIPPSAAEPAAGIASAPHEALLMPAAPFFPTAPFFPGPPFLEVPIDAPARLFAIGPKQCRWIIADEEAGADALMCGAPAERHRPFCAEHCQRAYMKPAEDEPEEQADEATEEEDPEEEETAE